MNYVWKPKKKIKVMQFGSNYKNMSFQGIIRNCKLVSVPEYVTAYEYSVAFMVQLVVMFKSTALIL